MRNSIGRRISLSIFIVIFITLLIFEAVFIIGVRQFYYGGASGILSDKAVSSASFYNMYLRYDDIYSKGTTILNNYEEEGRAELQIVDIDGNIIMSSTGFLHSEKIDVSDMNHLEVGEFHSWRGRMDIIDEEVLTVSTPLIEGNTIVGYLRFVSSIEEITSTVKDLILKAIFLGIFMLGLSLALAALLSRSIVKPIRHLTYVSRNIADGNFDIVADKKYDDEIGNLSDTINFMSNEIKKSNSLKNDFISSISHEIRTPLTSIRGWSETLSEDQINEEDTKQGIDIIQKESKRLTKLVEELLDFSRFESGRINMNFEKVDLNLLIKDVLKQYKIKFENKKLEIQCSLDERITFVNGDLDRLKQVFINIIDNAYKFTNEGGKISVVTEHVQKGAVVIIEDTGIGIPPSELPHITEKFYKGSNKLSGSGLGLAISKEIITLHKGTFHIDSQEGKGTKIRVTLK
ncbi:HAMP domain-containing sensor histidine kinase [Herbivorax sp. ANBcel31]|uniref:sensor histidine kinase n=1 Tax=Herbivorax sp. ANBcel31 TaxID=3069754 RepID=UPI0027B46893|nr:HAMP domain-containing sensor histidine kinase [Herbivorax sp. ANBcel31]MDQ2087534.1 HAMP domain-containing sensor histidine kinase [Herbivorax sp. ANBcel31]